MRSEDVYDIPLNEIEMKSEYKIMLEFWIIDSHTPTPT